MKNFLLLFMMLTLLLSCKDSERSETSPAKERDNEEITDTSGTEPNGRILEEASTETDGVATTEETEPLFEEKPSPTGLTGTYQRADAEDVGCNCNCIEISFTAPTELCISPDKIYITGRYEKTGDTTADLFLAEVVRSEDPEREIPWNDFDKDTPIATVTMSSNGILTLDWLGFSTDGEIAVDYAIYGKKSLEGDYRKK